jgi:hypothetical protein
MREIEKSITDELARRSFDVWTNIELTWNRGEISKPIIVPNNFDDMHQQALNTIDDYPFAFDEGQLHSLNAEIIKIQVQFFISGAIEHFYNQKRLFRDHAIYSQRSIVLHEKPRDIDEPLTTSNLTMYNPPNTECKFWAGYRAID